jgi:phage tail protein X
LRQHGKEKVKDVKEFKEMDSFNYVTVEGDRWDLLAWRFYGGMYGISILADANTAVQMDAFFPYGTVLTVPIIESVQINNNENLPPWKR